MINIHTILRIITHPAFFFAVSSVDVTKATTFHAIIKNRAPTTKYRATFMKGNKTFSYNDEANLIHLGLSISASLNSAVIIPLSPTKLSAKNLAETMIIIHIIPNITSLIHSFIVFSSSDVIILYHPMNATAIHTTIKISMI